MCDVIEFPGPDKSAAELRAIVESDLPEAIKTRARAQLRLHPAAPVPSATSFEMSVGTDWIKYGRDGEDHEH